MNTNDWSYGTVLQSAKQPLTNEEAAMLAIPLLVCEVVGFQKVMLAVSQEWARRDPIHALTLGPARGPIDPTVTKR